MRKVLIALSTISWLSGNEAALALGGAVGGLNGPRPAGVLATATAGATVAQAPAGAPGVAAGGPDGSGAALEGASPPVVDPGPPALPKEHCGLAPGSTPGCRCYEPSKLKKIADGLTELTICRVTLAEKNRLIDERLISVPVLDDAPRVAWWQEPTMIVGGTVVTVGVTAALTALLLGH